MTPVMVTILELLVVNTGASSALLPSHTIQLLSTGNKLDGNAGDVFGWATSFKVDGILRVNILHSAV